MFGLGKPTTLPAPDEALRGREQPWFQLAPKHVVLDAPVVTDQVPDGHEVAIFGLGCFWGAEEIYWQVPGVWSTSVGYAGGHTSHPSYEEVCSGRTGHTEAVRIVFDPAVVSYADLVKRFFEIHDPTQGMRQGNDVGTQYRSAIYWTTPEQEQTARELTKVYADELGRRRLGDVTTEIRPADGPDGAGWFYAEDVHQQYLAKNPFGYRCHANTGVPFPTPAGPETA
jgi:peptide-methionine (S)-S-oxide reductase